jgi:predicted phage tail protein
VKLKSPMELLGPSSSADFSDSHFEFGKTYLYAVRSVAQFGSDAVESADSAPAAVTPRDIFSPAEPRGLEAAIIPVTPQAPAYVELSWAISSEGDLAGYHVYRSDSEDTPGDRINNEILPSPAFRDISIVPGRRYFYRVSAVDRAGNESPKSSAVQTEVPLSGQ